MARTQSNALSIVALAGVGALLVACGSAADPSRVSAVEALTGDTANGKSLYEQTCTSCHGTDGKSGSETRNVAADAARDRTSAINQVLAGGGSMPAYANQFSDQEVADIVAYTASLQ